MNYELKQIPERTPKPREYGFTMAMDKGLSIREAEDFLSMCSDYVDIVKLGWGTSFVTPGSKAACRFLSMCTSKTPFIPKGV